MEEWMSVVKISEILSGDERGIAAAVISSWSGDGGPAKAAKRANENTRKESGLG